jgi:hypothetical protein
MDTLIRQQELPDVSTEQRRTNETIKKIRKLRWMGLESEAEGLQITLRDVRQGDCVVAQPHDTD